MNRRQLLVAGGSAGLLAATGTAVYAASLARTPGQRAAQAAAPPPSVVTVPVRRGQLLDETVLDGVLERAVTTDIAAPAAVEGASKIVVTRLKVAIGSQVRSGDVLMEVSGRPLIVLPGQFPAFRDLQRGDTGPDVRQLQEALRARFGTPRTSVFDSRTERDLRQLYQRAGYAPVTRDVALPEGSTPLPAQSPTAGAAGAARRVVLPAGEIAFVPALPAQVAGLAAKVGAVAGGTVASLASGPWRVAALLDAAGERALSENRPEVTFGAGPMQDRRTSLLEIRERPAVGERPAYREGVFAVEGTPVLEPGTAQSVRVSRAHSAENSLIVPVSALWTGADGAVHVTVLKDGRSTQVPVTVMLSVLGEAAVTGELVENDPVVVAGHG
ncbi:hypothetical protein ACFQZ4_25790 [Catellatospora coxensis]|uniref:Multidrug efflux pump subunit AcrA (Membrane-fusion protein) n=1 Tax=Catellatospora coxensis TaxID=310354 RepID=A0A8J3PAZ2_9ACTN|nr:hypothetical protein [Catellatospora coxensis]GIG08336.1 hypothetical protein Cco03nite_50360 [Catellatospora coxensis]